MRKTVLYPEDYEWLCKMSSSEGPCWQIAQLASSVLEDMLMRIARCLNERCGSLLDDGWDYSDCGYQFRNGFECASWIKHGRRQLTLFEPKFDIDNAIEAAIWHVLSIEPDRLSQRLILAWYWTDEAMDDQLRSVPVKDLENHEIERILVPFLVSCVDEQMEVTSSYVDKQVAQQRVEVERLRKAQFEYNYDDHYCERALAELLDDCPNNELIEKALDYAKKFMTKKLSDDDDSIGFTVVYRDGGECSYVEFELDEDTLRISEGGYAQSEAGGDSYGDDVWRLDAYSHTSDSCDVVPRAIELLDMGAAVVPRSSL